MTEQEPEPPKTDETTFEDPPVVTPAPDAEARQRAELCFSEIALVLQRHRCHIQPFLRGLEPVGNDGSRALIAASYGIVPEL